MGTHISLVLCLFFFSASLMAEDKPKPKHADGAPAKKESEKKDDKGEKKGPGEESGTPEGEVPQTAEQKFNGSLKGLGADDATIEKIRLEGLTGKTDALEKLLKDSKSQGATGSFGSTDEALKRSQEKGKNLEALETRIKTVKDENARLDAAKRTLAEEKDPEKRKAAAEDMQRILTERANATKALQGDPVKVSSGADSKDFQNNLKRANELRDAQIANEGTLKNVQRQIDAADAQIAQRTPATESAPIPAIEPGNPGPKTRLPDGIGEVKGKYDDVTPDQSTAFRVKVVNGVAIPGDRIAPKEIESEGFRDQPYFNRNVPDRNGNTTYSLFQAQGTYGTDGRVDSGNIKLGSGYNAPVLSVGGARGGPLHSVTTPYYGSSPVAGARVNLPGGNGAPSQEFKFDSLGSSNLRVTGGQGGPPVINIVDPARLRVGAPRGPAEPFCPGGRCRIGN